MVDLPAAVAGGRYRLERVLGRGGMATVALGHDRELERPVAVKLLAENLAAEDSIRERFLREAVIAARLRHPNVVQVYDSGDDPRPYMVMEYVEGDTLADELRGRGSLPWPQAADAAVQACAGLEHAHANGVVHRDVKPHNLLRAAAGEVKLVDFGIAFLAEGTRLTDPGMLMGTAPYVAPEMLADERTITGAVDIYALGVVLYELTAGRRPYPSESLAALLEAQRDDVVPPSAFADLPPAVETVVLACLRPRPEDRPPSAAALAGALVSAAPRWSGAEPPAETGIRATEVTARLPSTEPAPAPPVRHAARQLEVRPVHVVAALATVAVLAAIVALLTIGDGAEPGTPEPSPVPSVEDPADQAREIGDWIERRTRGR